MHHLTEALRALKGRTLILTHHNADIDAVGSSVALHLGLKQLKIETDMSVPESIGKPARKLASGYKFIIDPDCKDYDNIVLVETSVPEQLASVKNLKADIIIDHHPPGKLVAKSKAHYIDESAKSAAQVVFLVLKELKVSVDKEIATAIAAGLVADSAHLRLAELREFEILVELLKTGIKYEDVLRTIETPIDPSESIAVLKAARRMELWKIGDLIVAISRVISHEAAAARGLVRMGADVAVVVAEKEKEVRISSRGKKRILDKGIDLSEVFKEVGEMLGGSGGGHNMAGSANGTKKEIKKATMRIVHYLEEKVGKQGKRLE